jgi:hypothetical protein
MPDPLSAEALMTHVRALAACRRERVSLWHARSVRRHRSTFVRFRVDGTRLPEYRHVAFTCQRTQQRAV